MWNESAARRAYARARLVVRGLRLGLRRGSEPSACLGEVVRMPPKGGTPNLAEIGSLAFIVFRSLIVRDAR